MAARKFESNVRSYSQRIRGLVSRNTIEKLNLDGAPLAQRLADVVSEHEWQRALHETSPDGTKFAPLSPKYLAWKNKHGLYKDATIGILFFDMLDEAQFRTRNYKVTGFWLTVYYGVSEWAKRKMGWFQRGSSKQNRPPRPVLGPDEELQAKLTATVQRAVKQTLQAAMDRIETR